MDISVNAIIEKISAQRNAYADEAARLACAVDVLVAQNAALEAKVKSLEPKTGQQEPLPEPASSQSVVQPFVPDELSAEGETT